MIRFGDHVYAIRELNAREYLGIEKIVRRAKDLAEDEPLSMESGDFTIGLLRACVNKAEVDSDDWDTMPWAEIEAMPAKLFQALSNEANRLNALTPSEEKALFFRSSTAEPA